LRRAFAASSWGQTCGYSGWRFRFCSIAAARMVALNSVSASDVLSSSRSFSAILEQYQVLANSTRVLLPPSRTAVASARAEGLDQKARVLAYVFLHDEVGSGEEEAAKNVEDGFGNYNKPNRTERMRRRARAGCSPDGRMNGKLYRQFLEAAQTNPSLRPVWVFLAPVSAKQRSLGRVRTSGAVGLHLRQR